MLRRLLTRVLDFLWSFLLQPRTSVTLYLGPAQSSTIAVSVPPIVIWSRETIATKVRSIARHRWIPSPKQLQIAGHEILLRDRFGYQEDMGPSLFNLTIAHSRRTWSFADLTPDDLRKARALDFYVFQTNTRFARLEINPPLTLMMIRRNLQLSGVVFPMVFKIPIISMRHFIDVHVRFAFNSIRRSKHPKANELIAYLCELLFLQQKTATTIFEFVKNADHVKRNKGSSTFIETETNAIMYADLGFAYLKAGVEKVVVLAGAAHGIDGLDNHKTHKARLGLLRQTLEKQTQQTAYRDVLLELVSTDTLEELNTWRSGLFHKKGIADLQPHGHESVAADQLPFRSILQVMHDQHVRNSALLLAALAMLTDELVRIDPPDPREMILDPDNGTPRSLGEVVFRDLAPHALAASITFLEAHPLPTTDVV